MTILVRRVGVAWRSLDLPAKAFCSILLIIFALCFLGPFFALPTTAVSDSTLQGPSASHFFGTDPLGRDIFARVLSGGRVSLLIGLAVALSCMFIAIVIGGIAGFYAGVFDRALMAISEFFQVVPNIILALVAAVLFGASPGVITVILVLTLWPQVARIVRAETLKVTSLGFVENAKAAGFSDITIFYREVLPNVLPPVTIAITMTVGRAILLESGLSFLGLGDVNNPSWGALLNSAQPFMQQAWWYTFFPGIFIFLVVLSVNILGDRLNDTVNPVASKI